MLTNKELYGTDDVPKIPTEICNKRIELLNEQLGKELEKPLKAQSSFLINKYVKGVQFWSKMKDPENWELY